MSFTLWRGVVGMVRPTRRPGTLEELIRILPEGIGIVPLLLNFKAGSNDEFLNSIPLYERFASELAEQGVDLGRGQAGVGLVDEPGVQAQLAQQGQRAEDREAVGVHVAYQAEVPR